MSKGRNLLLVLAVSLWVIVGGAAPAMAHNVLTDSDPADGATMAQGPDEVTLSFLSSLDPDNADLQVTGPDGASVVAGDPDFDGGQVQVPIDAALAGEYEISYDVLSNDGHWVDGTIEFTVTEGTQPSPTPAPPATTAPPAQTEQPATAEPAAQATDSAGVPGWTWLLLALAVAAAGAAAVVLVRRRRTG
ncbi:copper resistance protein CopC [Natronosporangium hydrolyticum]|uniref:Copper resistance protein CopC n=1 Tax=Natronosporangium hydrolyticum TaxID=2811111 RepID=A0A895YHV5_9ACTN|nr:copper resistance CopC family protein [Natronosporangium hydrolyticum]QSB13318.1 copper resistance protein CopC [Natronosporangium hydrolyticum]